jgi:GNAT superfamily N-acetyltransferase
MAETDKSSAGAGAIVVRSMSADDFLAACQLLAELGRPAPTDETRAQVRQAFDRHLANADTASLIALRDNRAVGLLSLHIRERLSQPVPEAWIPDFVVTAAEQGHGVAQQLMHRALEIARERGCYRVVLESYYHRQRAYRFYAREGFADMGKCFSFPLNPPGA